MTRCYICEKSDIMIPNSKVTYHGRKNGKKVQKTVRICNCCGAMMSDEEILEEVEKEHITQNQAERFLAEYMLRELHVISGKEAADKQVLSFINDFREDDKSIRQKFCAGYCYYFAVMLKDAFHRGEICWCAPLGHICWVDDNGVPYDIDGVCDSDCNFFIPIRYIREGIEDFRHVPGREFNASREYIQNAIQTFCKDVIANIENKGEKL